MNGYTFIVCMSCLYPMLRGTQAKEAALGASCTVQGTACETTNSECGSGSTCVCKNSHYDSNGINNIGGTCTQKVFVGGTCPSPSPAVPKTATCSDSVATCEQDDSVYRCVCPSTHYNDNGVSVNGGNCERKKRLVDVCPLTSAIGERVTCVDYNARCRYSGGSYKCHCADTHYDNDGTSNIGGICVSKVDLGANCPQVDACETSWSECSNSQKCVCQSSYYDTNAANTLGGQCSLKVGLGYNCPMPDACQSSRAECTGSTDGSVCKCKAEYYDDNKDSTRGGTCRDRRSLGAFCSNAQPINADQCKDKNARCTYSGSYYTCSCNDRYHQEESVCVADKALGESCNNANECSDLNAGCLSNKCTCDQQHYQYKPSGNAKDVCERVEQIQVTGITFSNIQTSQFTVSWTPPAGKESYVSGYTVEWRPTGTSVGGDTRNVSSASPQTLTGLTPGRAYEVKVISKNTATQPGSTRSTSSKKNQATEPSKPGTVTSTLNDLDARDNSITIRWGTSVGVTTQYRVKLIDGSLTVTSTTTTSRTAVISHSALKDGHIYTVHIEARSQAYVGNYLWSEKRISTVRTKVQVPDRPQNGFCKDPTDKSITLEWSKPADTRGDLVKYHIYVYQVSNTPKFIVSTTGTGTQRTVGDLDPGTPYTFKIYTENEMYNSTNYSSIAIGCKTKAKMTEPPTTLEITGITSRSFDISWMKPTDTHSAENYGYVLQIKDDQDKCVKEIIYKCSDCSGQFQISNLDDLCSSTVRAEIGKTKQELEGQLTYPASLNPDIAYTVTVTAINDAGRGYPANETERTLEEAPHVPYGVTVSEIKTNSCTISWNIDGPKPGKTNFTVILKAESPATSKEFTVTGFDTRYCHVEGLEEYWSYSVTVTAATSVGTKTSDRVQLRTRSAAPGKVSGLKITEAPRGVYTWMQISWRAPAILIRNSIIKEYSLDINTSGRNATTQSLSHENDENHDYTVVVNVVPEETYTFKVYATNSLGMKGEVSAIVKQAPAGVPVNIEDTLQIDIISSHQMKNVKDRQFTVTLVEEFFEESTNGQIQASGLIACSNNCNFEDIKEHADFNTMDNWQDASQMGFTLYRVTSPAWMDKLETHRTRGRSKRAVTNVEYTVGSDDCSNNPQKQYCNGPLKPGTSYKLVAVSCTNGGCLLSKVYGPFVTAANEQSNDGSNCSTESIIIGVVLGFTNLLLLVYTGYATFIIRRIRADRDELKMSTLNKNDRKSQTYVNESFMEGVAGAGGREDLETFSNVAPGRESETEYSRLDDNTREDITTYDIIQSSRQY